MLYHGITLYYTTQLHRGSIMYHATTLFDCLLGSQSSAQEDDGQLRVGRSLPRGPVPGATHSLAFSASPRRGRV